ncbi:hypothetical protein [Pseudomonas sp. TWP3-1]|uniref:hypothetical protein n=1 Tax=Pseudomonas sp. TWP3-1 TaxID=2804631 RepID=UPI003CF6168D
MQLLAPERDDCFGCCGGFLQNASFPAPWRVHLLNDNKNCPIQAGKKSEQAQLGLLLTLHAGINKPGRVAKILKQPGIVRVCASDAMFHSIVKRAKAAAQFEHALCFVTKAYEGYLMNIAMNAAKHTLRAIMKSAYDRTYRIKLQQCMRCAGSAGHGRHLTAHLSAGLSAHYPPLL